MAQNDAKIGEKISFTISFRTEMMYKRNIKKKKFFQCFPLETLKWPNGLNISQNEHRNGSKVLKIEFFI